MRWPHSYLEGTGNIFDTESILHEYSLAQTSVFRATKANMLSIPPPPMFLAVGANVPTPPLPPPVTASLLHVCIRRTKESSAGEHAGKYGLGLTLSLLYSQKHFGGYLKVGVSDTTESTRVLLYLSAALTSTTTTVRFLMFRLITLWYYSAIRQSRNPFTAANMTPTNYNKCVPRRAGAVHKRLT